jgi:hypothetical protein
VRSSQNLCSSCSKDFTSVDGFDAHRVGVHAYTYAEGVAMEPIREDGRRCLDVDELVALGYEQDEDGRWFNVAKCDATRRYWSDEADEAA